MMRRATVVAAALAVVLFSGALSKPASADVSFSFFYSNLSPYGTWAVSANYGQVWRPYEYAAGWNPYYDGHWAYTDYGWAWVSDYAWGSVPYHYGTWALDPALGWIWVPGYVWAPSWVVFSSGPDYIGWAPVPPRYVVGASISFASFGPDRCVFVPARSFLAPRVRGYAVPRADVNVAISRTHIVNNITVQNHIVVNRGPDPRGIERATGRTIRAEPIARVKHVAPNGRFDAQEVRADRYAGGGAPRVTAPELSRRSDPTRSATQTGGPHHPAPAHQPTPAARPEPSRHQAQASQPTQAKPPAESHQPQARAQQGHAQPHGQQMYGPPAQAQQGHAAAKPQHSGQPQHQDKPQKQQGGKHGGH
jgi:hypothetical protein